MVTLTEAGNGSLIKVERTDEEEVGEEGSEGGRGGRGGREGGRGGREGRKGREGGEERKGVGKDLSVLLHCVASAGIVLYM